MSSRIAALQAPVATDLRLVMGAIRMAGSLERMGDLAVHIAKQVRLRYPNPSIPAELLVGDTYITLSAYVVAALTASEYHRAALDVAVNGLV
jgi:phosphate uptake regulator